jgi:glycerol-3-phosphate dehydrogenase
MDEVRASEFIGDLSKIAYDKKVKYDYKLKNREENLKELMDPTTEYDILIVGGGANGSGVVIDAASRGLKCAVIDKFDFASGTSSRSTKMAHGGIRYFEQMMFLQGDPI